MCNVTLERACKRWNFHVCTNALSVCARVPFAHMVFSYLGDKSMQIRELAHIVVGEALIRVGIGGFLHLPRVDKSQYLARLLQDAGAWHV